MKRREFITLLGGVAAAWPIAARAQQPAMPLIGLLGSLSPDRFSDRMHAFHQGLGETGFVVGRNVAIEYRWADGQFDRLPPLAAELVRRRVNVIVTGANIPAALAAKAATATIPIVFQIGGDPVAVGLVASLSRPGGNVTGVTTLTGRLGPKKLELLHEVIPSATTLAALLNPTSPVSAEAQLKDLHTAASTLGINLHVVYASSERDFDAVMMALSEMRAGGLVIGADNLFTSRGDQLGALTHRHAVPAIAGYRPFSASGGLMSYGDSFTDPFRQVGIYTGRILKGDKPADLPVQQSAKIELIINLKSARALGLTMPLPLLGRADEVIE